MRWACLKFTLSATESMDKKLIIWDLHNSLPRCTCDHEDGVTCLTWLGASRYVAKGCAGGKVRLWDSLSGNCVKTFHGHSDAILDLSVSANCDFIIYVLADETSRVFEIAKFR